MMIITMILLIVRMVMITHITITNPCRDTDNSINDKRITPITITIPIPIPIIVIIIISTHMLYFVIIYIYIYYNML